MAKKATPAPAPSPITEQDLANAQAIVDGANYVIPLLKKGVNCGLVQCSTYLQQAEAQLEFAQQVLAEYGSGH